MAANVAVERDAAGNLKPSKKKRTERIDGILAAIRGLGRAMVGGPAFESVYETRGADLHLKARTGGGRLESS
jgi:phage terminase large subunit-like protein